MKINKNFDSYGKYPVYRDEAKKELITTQRFKLDKGGTESFTYPADKQVKKVSFFVSKGDFKVKINQQQQNSLVKPDKSTVKKTLLPEPLPQKTAPKVQDQIPFARMILVLDASGSMWGQLNGKAKIAIAKDVMTELIDDIPKNFHTGLTVYGHRRKGDCHDIEMILAPGPHNPAAMKQKIMAISPKGKTPLSEAVKQAAEALKYSEEKTTVVLVSDGLETCHTDPCGLAAQLAATGMDFTVHVIGFDISKGDQERLRCLADKTGGLFLSADNAGSLREALFKTVEKIKEPPQSVVEDPGTAELSAPKTVAAGSRFQVKWQGPDSKQDYIAISKKDSEDSRCREYRRTKTGNPVEFKAPGDIGTYELRYVHNYTRKVIGRTEIMVTPVEASVETSPSVNAASEFEVAWQGPDYAGDYIAIAVPEEPAGRYIFYTYTSKGSPLKLRAPSDPGNYEVRYIMNHETKLLAKTSITIAATTAQVQAPESASVATDIEISWQGPDNKTDYIAICSPVQRPGHYINYTHTHRGSPLKVRAPSDPGTYEIRYMQDQGSKILATTAIKITPATASVQAPESAVAGGQFEVIWTGPDNKSDYISIARPDQKTGQYINYTYTNKGTPLKIRAPSDPGTYAIRYILGRGDKLLVKTSMEIKPVTASIQAPGSAAAGSKFEVIWQGPGYKGDYISIARQEQSDKRYIHYTYTSRGNPLKLLAPSESGTYEIRYILGRGRKLLAKSTIKIDPVTASLQGPGSAAAGSGIEVAWQGPCYNGDYISIALPDQRSKSYKTYTYVRQGNPVRLKVPKKAGNYEIRYIMSLNHTLLFKKALTVTP